jgi:hypothetical protein
MMVPTNNHARHANGRKKRLRPGQPAFGAKLDAKLQQKFCKHVREGLSFETVCALCRVGRATFYQWMQRGRAEEGTRYAEFAAAVERAEADAVRTLHIRVAASNPQWILERRHPSLYGPPKLKTETELTGPGGGPVMKGNPYTVSITCNSPRVAFPIKDESGKGGDQPPPGYRKETDRHRAIWFIPISADAMADASWISAPKL